MKLFGIAGFKDSGKTTLVVELVREFRARGLRVATVKHAHHDFDVDQPGKDSYEHRAAGAQEVLVASGRRWAHIRELADEPEPSLSELLKQLGPADIVLVEGYKHGTHPRLELRREGAKAPPLADGGAGVVAIVADYPIGAASVPVLPRAEVAAIADFVWLHAAAVGR